MRIYPSELVTWVILAASGVCAHKIRGANGNHISHGQNDIRQLQGSDDVDVTVTVNAVGNNVTVTGNWYGDAVPRPTPSQVTPAPTTRCLGNKNPECKNDGDCCGDMICYGAEAYCCLDEDTPCDPNNDSHCCNGGCEEIGANSGTYKCSSS